MTFAEGNIVATVLRLIVILFEYLNGYILIV